MYTEQRFYHKKLKTMLNPDFSIKLNKVAGISHVLLRLVTEQVGSIDNARDLHSGDVSWLCRQ